MTFKKWAKKYGLDHAKNTFGLSDHLVLVIKPNCYVTGICGRWKGSEPLGGGQSEILAINRLKNAIDNSFKTCEIIQDS